MPRLRRAVPEAPRAPLDRITEGAARWAALIRRNRSPVFAATCYELAARFDPPNANGEARRIVRIAQANGKLNGRELMTALDILTTWPDAEPGAKMAVVIALVELMGSQPEQEVRRVLTTRFAE